MCVCVGEEELEGLMAGLVVWVIHSQLELSNGKHPPLTLVVSPFSKRSRSLGSKQYIRVSGLVRSDYFILGGMENLVVSLPEFEKVIFTE